MGKLDGFLKRAFAAATPHVDASHAARQDALALWRERMQATGYLRVSRPEGLAHLAAPWPEARDHEEVLVELKVAGDLVDVVAVKRALLRRQVREVERVEERSPAWMGEEPLWFVAPDVPSWLHGVRVLERFAPGCYRVGPSPFPFLWIAANELPLCDDLVPFLVARSGQALDDFARWVAPRREMEWVLNMVQHMPISPETREELMRKFGRSDDPEIEARRQEILQALLASSPEAKDQLIKEGQLTEARAVLRRVFAGRGFAPTAALEARIDACSRLTTLHRWLDKAVTAASAEDALT
ncbi:hypothetical protein AB3662_31280 [Sorangium cellulosum]|uniref:hypothetical protein n=1 Tax=Sorangium cellulosum TaxID=56 RepID=UPI003D9AA5F2